MKLIVGLGNKGKEYEDTRHNIGFMVVDKLSKELATNVPWEEQKERKALVWKAGDIMLAKPTTLMNASGEAVAKLLSYNKINVSDVWVVHDDLDLPLGKIRIREQGASAGHNGVESIISAVGTDKFIRFRLGIGRGREDRVKPTDINMRHRTVIDFVLSRFTEHEAGDMRKLVKNAVVALRISLEEGIDKAMNRFN